MEGNTNQNLGDTAVFLFSMLPTQKKDEIIDLLKSLLSERQSSSADPRSVEKTGK